MVLLAKAHRGHMGHLGAHSNSVTIRWQNIIEKDGPDRRLHARTSAISIMMCPGATKGVERWGVFSASK